MRLGLIFILMLAGGCATYEYDLVQPADLSRHIAKDDAVFMRDAIEYRLNSIESRLILRAYNTTGEPMTLDGEKSFVVDEHDQSHPLRSITIAPHSYMKMILPPPPTRIERVGPSIGIGIGGVYGDARRSAVYGWDYYGYDYPHYLAIYDEPPYYWTWNNESDVRLTLYYEQGQNVIRHEFVFSRRKVK